MMRASKQATSVEAPAGVDWPTYSFLGVSIVFPFEAYECQRRFMEGMVQAMRLGQNALLESPTGTGKTMCLLSAALGWRESERQQGRDPPKIIYATRTHSQISQVMEELEKTYYAARGQCTAVAVGSREQLCVHQQVKKLKGTSQVSACRALVKQNKCRHYNKLRKDSSSNVSSAAKNVLDIEDLHKMCEENGGCCPYYSARKLQSETDVLVLPYNYLVDPSLRHSLTADIRNGVVIFDEGHNIESFCCESSSKQLSTNRLLAALNELQNAIDIVVRKHDEASPSEKNSLAAQKIDLETMRGLITMLATRIDEIEIKDGQKGFEKPFSYFVQLLHSINIDQNSVHQPVSVLEGAQLLLENDGESADSMRGWALKPLLSIFELLVQASTSSLEDTFRVYVSVEKCGNGGVRKMLDLWCFDPAYAMSDLQKTFELRTIILASGTLSPLDSLASSLGIQFPVQIEGKHVISPNQILVGALTQGVNGKRLDSSYRYRDTPEYLQELGETILSISNKVPGGLLVFFPSYTAMDSAMSWWKKNRVGGTKSSTLFEQLEYIKPVVVERRSSSETNTAIESFEAHIASDKKKGCLVMAVCRGKMSEGINFTNHRGRAVLITGIPYPSKADAKVMAKRAFLNDRCRKNANQSYDGEKWYSHDSIRAVNQAIGRVIRHKDDYGAIIFMDARLSDHRIQRLVSLWVRAQIKSYGLVSDLTNDLSDFFRTHSLNDYQHVRRRKTKLARQRLQTSKTVGERPENQASGGHRLGTSCADLYHMFINPHSTGSGAKRQRTSLQADENKCQNVINGARRTTSDYQNERPGMSTSAASSAPKDKASSTGEGKSEFVVSFFNNAKSNLTKGDYKRMRNFFAKLRECKSTKSDEDEIRTMLKRSLHASLAIEFEEFLRRVRKPLEQPK